MNEKEEKTDFEKDDEAFSKQIFQTHILSDDILYYKLENTKNISLASIYAFVQKTIGTYLWHFDGFNLNSDFSGQTNFSGYILW